MNKFNNISNSELSHIIDEWIKNERDRALLKRRFIDGIGYERLAEEFDLSAKQVYRIIIKSTEYLYALCTDWVSINCL
jgi:hypothetical protein